MVAARPQIVVSALLQEIDRGRYPVGRMLPTENELAERHDVSRATVRTALMELQNLGMISRRRGSGTRVIATSPVQARDGFSQSLGRFEDVVQYADTTRRVILDMKDVVADFELAKKLGCKPGTRWLHVAHLRVDAEDESELPICWTDLYVIDIYANLLRRELPSFPGAAIALIEKRHGTQASEIEQTIKASGLPPAVSKKLCARDGEHALEIIRRYVSAVGAPVMVTFSFHPSDRFSYAMKLKRNGANGN